MRTVPEETLLQLAILPLGTVINLARGAAVDDWPPPAEWKLRFRQMKDAIDEGDLPVPGPYAGRPANRYTKVRLEDLPKWSECQDARWEPLHAFCTQWAAVHGSVLDHAAQTAEADQSVRTASSERAEAITQLLTRGRVPGRTVNWKQFIADVRAICGKSPSDYGFADRTIIREANALAQKMGLK
jgi:hypothetical protein